MAEVSERLRSDRVAPARVDQGGSRSVLPGVLLGIFEAVNCGAVLLDTNKRVLGFNARAEKCFGDALRLANARLCAPDRMCDVMLQTALDQALKYRNVPSRPVLREAVGLTRDDKPCIVARVLPVTSEAEDALDRTAAVVVLIDPEDCGEPSHVILEQAFGLTKSESRVASRLMCGQSLQEIAKDTGVATGTVRSQIKSVFAKTNTNRQAQLVGLLTRLAMTSEHQTDHRTEHSPNGRDPGI